MRPDPFFSALALFTPHTPLYGITDVTLWESSVNIVAVPVIAVH